MSGMGPAGHEVTAPRGGAVIFVEVAYTYQPLISSKVVPNVNMTEIAAMPVRDQRSLTLPTNTEKATISTCTCHSSIANFLRCFDQLRTVDESGLFEIGCVGKGNVIVLTGNDGSGEPVEPFLPDNGRALA